MTDESKEWVELAKQFAEDPTAKLACPRCGREPLQVIDTPIGDTQVKRHLIGTLCNAYNEVRMPRL